MDIGRAYKCAISSRDLGIVGIALQNAEPRGTKVVRGLGECDDIALLGLSLKERDLLSPLNVLVLCDNHLRDLCPVGHTGTLVDLRLRDIGGIPVPKPLNVEDSIQIIPDPCADGKQDLRQIVPAGCDWQPTIYLYVLQICFDDAGHRAADFWDNLSHGLSGVDAAIVLFPMDEPPNGGHRGYCVLVRTGTGDVLDVKIGRQICAVDISQPGILLEFEDTAVTAPDCGV